MRTRTFQRAAVVAVVAVIAFTGCAAQSPVGEETVRVDTVQPAGFLEDYSILKKGGEGEASLVYWDSSVDLGAYDSVVIDPVTIWLASDSALKKASVAERQRLADEFHAALATEIGKQFNVVRSIGPRTLRLRVALTDAQKSNPTLDTISTYIPQARLLQSVATIGSDTAGFVGEASAEADLRDANTGKLIAAGVDRRAGTKAVSDSTFDSWNDARAAFSAWGKQFTANMAKRRK